MSSFVSVTGLDECLERLRHHESEELSVQISAYIDNEFDVAGLMEEAETKAAALERVHELEEEVWYNGNMASLNLWKTFL